MFRFRKAHDTAGTARAARVCLLAPLVPLSLLGCEPGPPNAALRVHHPSAAVQGVRPTQPGGTFGYETTDDVTHYDTPAGNFRVHYSRSGPNQVKPGDADDSGVPDFVEQAGAVYEDVLETYLAWGFDAPPSDAMLPNNGGDGRFDVYLVDFAGVGDGHFSRDGCETARPGVCAGHMQQENDYVGYSYPNTLVANRILASHEFFHAVQAGYNGDFGSAFNEGTAVWATERFDPSLRDFEHFIDGYLDASERSLDSSPTGPVDPFTYGMGLFFQFLHEKYGDDAVLALHERLQGDPRVTQGWLAHVDDMLRAEHGSTFAEAMVAFTTWNMQTGRFATDGVGYEAASTYAELNYEDGAVPTVDDRMRAFYASARTYRAVTDAAGDKRVALAGDADDLEGLRLVVGVREALALTDVQAGADTVDITTGSQGAHLHIAVVNTALSGSSKKPALCAGTPDAVAACVAAHTGGAPDAGPSGDGGPDAPEQPGCNQAGPGPFVGLAGLLLAWAARRQRA